ncbi:hypothetical protein K469DRAFT_600118, partial [Zopfia rhizophila CBS 207.26]
PSPSLKFTSTLGLASNSFTTGSWPISAAQERAVRPSPSSRFISTLGKIEALLTPRHGHSEQSVKELSAHHRPSSLRQPQAE